jgi:hypothetical protein
MSLETGFHGRHEVASSVKANITADQAERYFTDGIHANLSYIDDVQLKDSVWDDATKGIDVANTILGFLARRELQSSFTYQAVPGYHEKPKVPPLRRELNMTVFDLERASLAYEQGVFERQIVEPAKTKTLADKKAEKTMFNKA